MASVDVKKAFDSVSHRAVVTALESLGATSQVINTIKSVLSEVFMYFNVSGRTVRVKMERGVPQAGRHQFSIKIGNPDEKTCFPLDGLY